MDAAVQLPNLVCVHWYRELELGELEQLVQLIEASIPRLRWGVHNLLPTVACARSCLVG